MHKSISCKRPVAERIRHFIQPINYPTVPKGTERLRITPTPWHDDTLIDQLAQALADVWCRLALPLGDQQLAAEALQRLIA